MTTLSFNDPASVLAGCEALCYYFNMRLLSRKTGRDSKIPEAVGQIIELAKTLPKPEIADWSPQANGKLPGKQPPKPKPAENGTAAEADPNKKTRGTWTDDKKQELVRLVESEEYRKEKFGSGNLVWAIMARHFGFAKANPLQRQYQVMTGKEPPGMRTKKEPAAGEAEGAPDAKKAKVYEAPAAPVVPVAAPVQAAGDGWSPADMQTLRNLVENPEIRKQLTGKSHLKWSRIAEHLDKGKKECKKKYCALTGKTMDDLENLE